MPILTPPRYRTAPAFGHARFANVAPVQYQPVMGIRLELVRRELQQAAFDLFRVAPGREVRAVGDAKHVRIDCNGRFTEHRVQHDVSRFSPDTWQRFERVSAGGIDEVVLAMNATLEGQTTAHYIAERLEGYPVRITQLAHGLPVGGELDYLDEGTLAQALRARRPMV